MIIVMVLIGLLVFIFSLREILYKPRNHVPIKTSCTAKKNAIIIISPEILSKTLNEIEKERLAFTEQMLKKKLVEHSMGDKKKTVKKGKRKHSDPVEHDGNLEVKPELISEDKKALQTNTKKNKEQLVLEEAKKANKRIHQKKTTDTETKSQCLSPQHNQEQKYLKKPNKEDIKPSKEKSEEVIASIMKVSQAISKDKKAMEAQPSSNQSKVHIANEETPKANDNSNQEKNNENHSKNNEVNKDANETAKSNESLQKKTIETPSLTSKAEAQSNPKTESAQEEFRPIYYQQSRGFDYRDQYHYYTSSTVGKYFRRGPIKYSYRHPQTIYQKKLTYGSFRQNVERKNFVNKSFTELLKESDDEKVTTKTTPIDFGSEKKISPSVQTNPAPLESTEEALLPKNMHKSRTYSITSEESGKRRGLGGILLRTESPNEEVDDNGKDQKNNEAEITEKWSEQDFYNWYNPLDKFDLKLPDPFTVKEENEEKEEEKHYIKSEVSLFEAYKSANLLLGGRSFLSEVHPTAENEKFVSPLSELRGDSIEYIPNLQRRFIGGNNKSEDAESNH